jgi:hypothetical protein
MRYPQRQASTTDEQGRFEIVGNHPHGSFDVVAMNDIVVGRAIVEADRTRSLTEESVVELELGARRGVVIRGKVLEDGEPVPEVVMTLRRQTQNDGDRTTYTEIATTRTDADGTYRLPGLLKGDHYMVDASPPFLASDPEWRHGMPYSQEVPEIRTGELVLPDMHLIRYEQTLAGRVVDPNGKPVPGATVHAEFAHGMPLGRLQEGEPPWTETDDQGRFRLTNLPNRTLRLMAYIRPKNGGSIQFPAQVSTTQNQQDVRIVLDASLVQDEE